MSERYYIATTICRYISILYIPTYNILNWIDCFRRVINLLDEYPLAFILRRCIWWWNIRRRQCTEEHEPLFVMLSFRNVKKHINLVSIPLLSFSFYLFYFNSLFIAENGYTCYHGLTRFHWIIVSSFQQKTIVNVSSWSSSSILKLEIRKEENDRRARIGKCSYIQILQNIKRIRTHQLQMTYWHLLMSQVSFYLVV